MNCLGDELLQLGSCPTIPENYPKVYVSPKKQSFDGLMLGSDLLLPLQEEQEDFQNTSDPNWWIKKAESTESDLWREYGLSLANSLLQN